MNDIDSIVNLFNKVANWFFGSDGMHLIHWYFILLISDVLIGFIKAVLKGNARSRTYLKGIVVKMCAIFGIVISAMLDDIFEHYLHVNLGFVIVDLYTISLLLYESLSIIENLNTMGVFTGKIGEIINRAIDITSDKDKSDENKK